MERAAFRVAIELLALSFVAWAHRALYVLNPLFLLAVSSPFLLIAHWGWLRGKGVPKGVRRTLLLVTGPLVLLSTSLVLCRGSELVLIAKVGGRPKEMIGAAHSAGISPECAGPWFRDLVRRMNSELVIYGAVLAVSGLLYESRLAAAQEVATVEVLGKNCVFPSDEL